MKNVLFITLCLVLIAPNLQSQTKVGLKFGPTISTISSIITPYFSSGVGASFNAGFYFDKNISKRIGINYGINYYSSNYGKRPSFGVGSYHIMIPLNFKFYTGKNFSIDLGPQFSYLIDNKKYYGSTIMEIRPIIDVKPSVGFSLNLTENIFLDSKYILSVFPFKVKGITVSQYFQSFNVSFGFTLFNKGNSKTRLESLLPTNN